MPIRTLTLSQIVEGTLRQMIDDEVQEDTTLDFKREIGLDGQARLSKVGKLKFLEHVTSLANALGGAVLYGAEEGRDGRRGQIVALPGMDIDADPLIRWLGQLLVSQVDEPLTSAEIRAVRVGDRRYCLIVRVPASPLAPHMIRLPADESDRARFYIRGNAVNEPMTARQIKEVTMRSETAVKRAQSRIAARHVAIQKIAQDRYQRMQGRGLSPTHDCVAVHLIPLYDTPGGPDLSNDAVVTRMQLVRPFGEALELDGWSQRIGLEGLASESDREGEGVDTWTLLLRGGGLEYVAIDTGWTDNNQKRRINGAQLERQIVGVLEQARILASDGLLALPIVLSVQLFNAEKIILDKPNRCGAFRDRDIAIAPALISRWETVPDAITVMFNVLWQASGIARSPYSTAKDAAASGTL